MATTSMPKNKRACPDPPLICVDDIDEDRLAKKIFGDNRVKTESRGDVVTVVEEKNFREKSIWHDDDDAEEVQMPTGKKAVLLKRNTDTGGCVPADEYQDRLRKVFQSQQRGTPKWAKLDSKEKTTGRQDDSDSEVEAAFDEMTRSAIKYVEKDSRLASGTISYSRCPDVTVGYRMGPIKTILFHSVRPVVIAAGDRGVVQLFRVGNTLNHGHFLQNVQFSNFSVSSMGLTLGGTSLICGSPHAHFLMKYDLEKGAVTQLQLPSCIPRQNTGNFTLTSDGSMLAMVGRNAQVYVLSTTSMELIKVFSTSSNVVSLQFFPDSTELWAFTEGGQVHIWDMLGFHNFFQDEGCISGTKIRISRDGEFIACGSGSGLVNLYKTGNVRSTTTREPQPHCVIPNLHKNQAKLFHVDYNNVFSNYPPKNDKLPAVGCVEFSPHSGYLAIGGGNGHLIMERLHHFESY
ncbi:unnamed protein product [Nippostrongylus brasiliensis]|uniref:U3 small nucleolar RNA-associated protein 18 homolog n=1 Tax=Nippostrongylus brasiliensis TaxID=27835 RepID=A0A158R140_NIPBR|nr:unnamed protein product [Nippostrongylus brasiliensis]